MEKCCAVYSAYVQILRDQLKPAMGCTEPAAIAYAAAIARDTLGCLPESLEILASGNIVKNVKSVTVPNTNGLKGIAAAAAAGVVAGAAKKELQVISLVSEEQKTEIAEYLAHHTITVSLAEGDCAFDVTVVARAKDGSARVRLTEHHTHVALIEKNGSILLDRRHTSNGAAQSGSAESKLSVADIFNFAKTCDIEDIRGPLALQIEYNTAIAREGLRGDWGANVGKVILESYTAADISVRARAMAAAASDARMSGCELPVVINSGSGNQGITVSLPVIEFARERKAGEAELLRALALSNLIAIHLKSLIGCLSAYCGAVSAGCAAGAGVAFLCGGDLWMVSHTLVNSLAILSGTICDGAKPSCAAKIAAAVDAGLLGYHMALHGRQFRDGEGIVQKGVENTIRNVGCLGRDGMRETDREILRIMLGQRSGK